MLKVLIVDDNTTLAYFTARNLERDIRGLRVSTASSCAEARKKAGEDSFAIVIVDLNLSDGSGADLIDEILSQSPEISAILISGETPSEEIKPNIFGFLNKPYEAPSLSELVRSALSKQPKKPYREQDQAKASTTSECEGYNSHRVRNQLSALLAGLRSFGTDLRANAHNAEAVNKTVDEYLETLCDHVREVNKELSAHKTSQKISD
jgi:DNA-binding NtrC family response regulator